MKNYFKTSKGLRWAVAGVFGLMLALNIMVSLDFEKDKLLPSLTLVELGNRVFAQSESGDEDCPGGSCSHTEYFGGEIKEKCTACCPTGKSPKCNSSGCECW